MITNTTSVPLKPLFDALPGMRLEGSLRQTNGGYILRVWTEESGYVARTARVVSNDPDDLFKRAAFRLLHLEG